MARCEADLYRGRGHADGECDAGGVGGGGGGEGSAAESARTGGRGDRRCGEGRGERASQVHCAPSDAAARCSRGVRGVRGRPGLRTRQHSQLSLPHDSHTTGERLSSLPLLLEPSRLGSHSADANTSSRAVSARVGLSRALSGRVGGILIQGSSAVRAELRDRLPLVFRSASLILRHGSPCAMPPSPLIRSRRRDFTSPAPSRPTIEASGDDRSLRTARGNSATASGGGRVGDGDGEGVGEGVGDTRGLSECERARGVCARLAGVTSLKERRCMRRRTPDGESVSVTLILMLWTSPPLALVLLSRSSAPPSFCWCESRGLVHPFTFALFLAGPARLGPAPAS